jgi:hypothetical protein
MVQTVVADGTVTGTHAWGTNAVIKKEGASTFAGKIENNTLAVAFRNGATAYLPMQADGTLAGRYVQNGVTSKGVFRKRTEEVAAAE